MNQTAVQWFATRVTYLKISPKEMHDFLDWYEEAKQMEKEQIEDAYDSGMCEGFDLGFKKDYETEETGEKFYQEKYETNG